MSPRWTALAGVLVLGLSAPVSAQDTSDRRPAAVEAAPGTVAANAPPPFWLAGVVIGPERRSAVLVPLDDARREVGIVTVHEGDSYDGHRLVAVEPDRVVLEGKGTVFSLPVGRPYAGPRGTPETGARAGVGPIFIPGPDKPKPDFEYTGPQVKRGQGVTPGGGSDASPPPTEDVQNFTERLFSHPSLQQQIEEIRPLIRQKMEGARPVPGDPRGTSR